ncbi:MAG: DNA repair protein rad2 [Candelina submexicana]|nr:MAG: DNA repair protein rad2 [Candelina submexicana]
MGVTGLWTVVQPCARPIKIETLNKKRLAVDASIWIYQFLKAVRDKEGNALRNSHVVGFFRRICKLLFFGIKPVFVFDGGAPTLKRQTISGRKQRREGRREDAVRTAGKLLAVQMQRRAEEDDRKRREEREVSVQDSDQEEPIPENLVYVDEIQMTPQERQQSRHFKKKDAYHLPDLDVSLADMGAPNDPRIMSHEELEEYARHFHDGEDINLYDFSKIDFNSPFFLSLPASDRYNILNAARLRSRLRMGYSKEQLDTMFPDRMAFSRFQIERVTERNELTQRLMNINGMNGEDAMFGANGGGRVAGEKGKEYVLVKNDGVEGGWALGVVGSKDEGERNKPIDVDQLARTVKDEQVEEEADGEGDEDEFEDVPIVGLNRLPKRALNIASETDPNYDLFEQGDIQRRRQALYESREGAAGQRNTEPQKPRTENPESLFLPEDFEDGSERDNDETMAGLFEDPNVSNAMEEDDDLERAIAMSLESPKADDDDLLDSIKQQRPEPPRPFNKGSGRSIAHVANSRSNKAAPKPSQLSDGEEDDINLQTALAESRKSKSSQTQTLPKQLNGDEYPLSSLDISAANAVKAKDSPFDGPLPFEKLNLGRSLLGKKKTQATVEKDAGGFERASASKQQDKAKPPPPWFSGEIQSDANIHRVLDENRSGDGEHVVRHEERVLRRTETGEVIDIDSQAQNTTEPIIVESSEEEIEDVGTSKNLITVDSEVRMGDVADLVRAEPPISTLKDLNPRAPETGSQDQARNIPEEETYEWDESDYEDSDARVHPVKPAGGIREDPAASKSPSTVFENIANTDDYTPQQQHEVVPTESHATPPPLLTETSIDQKLVADEAEFSDPEDDELMRQLAVEAEEHARFVSELNHKSQTQNAEDYERELRQLRNQQKKDRRDADEVSHIMVTECQQLLQLFGLPYVTAPMEAEAQCAELVSLGLVDGIVTDDSDIFLFGGTRVYKNMFNQAKFVECYLASDLEKEFDLDRRKLIRLAHLLGSDYTEGLPSVGPVTALEILSEFNSDRGLEDFKEWWQKVQTGERQKLLPEDSQSTFRKKFRRNATKIFLDPGFPDPRVDVAYLEPEVDSNPSPFAWGVPDLDALRSFLMATIGWSQERTDEVLVPVIKDMNRRENEGTQANITSFFSGGGGAGAFAPRRRKEGKSRRMESALGRLQEQAKRKRGVVTADEMGDATEEEEEGEDAAQGSSGNGSNAVEVDDVMSTTVSPHKAAKKKRTGTRAAINAKPDTPTFTSMSEEEPRSRKRPRKRTAGVNLNRGKN